MWKQSCSGTWLSVGRAVGSLRIAVWLLALNRRALLPDVFLMVWFDFLQRETQIMLSQGKLEPFQGSYVEQTTSSACRRRRGHKEFERQAD